MTRTGRGYRERTAALLFLLFAVPAMEAQLKCPPLAEGMTCTQYHYHVMAWHPQDRTYREFSGTRQFISIDACEKARSEAAKEKASLAEFLKMNGDSAFQPDQFRECHCDRTTDPSSGVFLDTAGKIAQRRIEHDAAWATREKLLSSEAPRAGEHLQILFGREVRADRYLRMTVPARLPEPGPPPPPATLRDTKIGSAADRPTVGANLLFIDIPVHESDPSAAATAGVAPGKGELALGFFQYEVARADAILAASERLTESGVKAVIGREIARRKRVLANLRRITRSCDAGGPTVSAIRIATDEAGRLAVIRRLFGNDVVSAWAPADARAVAENATISAEVDRAVMFDSTADVDARRGTLYAALGDDRQLSDADTATFVNLVEELVSK